MKPRSRVMVLVPLLLLSVLMVGILVTGRFSPSEADRSGHKLLVKKPADPPPQPAASELNSTDQLPPAVRDSAGSREYVRQVLSEILPKYREAMSHRSPHRSGALRAQEQIHYREARLLALAYPNEMELLLENLVRDSALNQWERLCCIDLLGELANVGMKPAQAALAELANGSEIGHSSAALRNLACADREGKYLELYRGKCRELVRNAFDAVSYYGGPSAVIDLELILARSADKASPEARVALAAKWTLEKIHILQSPECDRTLIGLIDGSKEEKDWFIWAAQVAKNRSTPGMTDALRRRLDRTEQSLFGTARSDEERNAFGSSDFATGSSSGIGDPYFDEALIAYAECGGTLNEPERQRLYRAGYACDPRKRLGELLATGR